MEPHVGGVELVGARFVESQGQLEVGVISTATLRQTVTPPELLGRASAISMTATGARPIGAALGAFLGAVYGAETCLIVAALGFVLQAMLIVMSPVLTLERQPQMVG